MRIAILSVGTAIVLCGLQTASAETLQSALAAAYNHNATLNAQRAATRAADEALPQAKSGYRPQILANANYGFSRTITRGDFGTVGTSLNPFGFGVTIQQNLFNGFRTINSVQAAEATIRASRETLRNIEQNTLFNAATAYSDVVQAIGLIDIRKRSLSFLKEQLRSSQARLEVGEGTRTDVAQSQAQLALARAQLSAAEAQLRAAEGTYFQIIGRRPKNLRTPYEPNRLYPKTLKTALVTGTVEHPAIRATQHLVDSAAFQVKVAEGAFLPTVTLDGSAARQFNPSSTVDDTTSLSATVNVTVPLYQAGNASSLVRQSKENLGQARIQVDESRDSVRNAVITAWTQLQSARANLRANREQIKAGRLALSGVIEERNVGQRTQLDVLDAQSVVLQAEELANTSARARTVAGYALVSAIGRLNSRRLNLKVRHYEPKQHYEAVKDRWYGLRTPSGR